MLKRGNNKGVAMLLVLGTVLVVVILANAIMGLIINQARLSQHQVGRIRAYYTTLGIMNYSLEMLRLGSGGAVGGWVPNDTGADKFACMQVKGCIDPITPDYWIPNDANIPYRVQVRIYPRDNSGIANTTQIDITTDYTYQ